MSHVLQIELTEREHMFLTARAYLALVARALPALGPEALDRAEDACRRYNLDLPEVLALLTKLNSGVGAMADLHEALLEATTKL